MIFILAERDGQAADGQHISRVRGQLWQRERHVRLQEVVASSRASRRRRPTGQARQEVEQNGNIFVKDKETKTRRKQKVR